MTVVSFLWYLSLLFWDTPLSISLIQFRFNTNEFRMIFSAKFISKRYFDRTYTSWYSHAVSCKNGAILSKLQLQNPVDLIMEIIENVFRPFFYLDFSFKFKNLRLLSWLQGDKFTFKGQWQCRISALLTIL